MRKTLCVIAIIVFFVSCNTTREYSFVTEKSHYTHTIDSLKTVIEVLRMKNKTDSLQILLDFYSRKRVLSTSAKTESSSDKKSSAQDLPVLYSPTTEPAVIFKKVFDKPNQTGTFKDDRDGQTYNWVKIGDQTWMAQNLNFKTPTGSWAYANDSTNQLKYGLLYDFYAIKELCPKGWHLPSETEWQELENYINKIANQSGDNGCNAQCLLQGGDSGFNIVFGGQISSGRFCDIEQKAYFFTSTQIDKPINVRYINKSQGILKPNRVGWGYKYSVRCVKDK